MYTFLFHGHFLVAGLELVFPVLEVVFVEGEFDGVAVAVGEADFDDFGFADGVEAFGWEFGEDFVGVFEGGFFVVEGDGVAWWELSGGGWYLEDGVIAGDYQLWFQDCSGVAVVHDGEVGGGDSAFFVYVGFEVDVAVGGEVVGAAMVHHVGVAPAEATC